MQRLFSPWRLRYITSARRDRDGCVFCRAFRGRRDRENLVLYRGRRNFVILNKYPYNNGHLMIVPNGHLPRLEQASADHLEEMMGLVIRCERALRAAYRPTGINLGMNLGTSAGAGIHGHYHLHLVPRWDGDTNFMTVVHGTRVIPESLSRTYKRLRPLLAGRRSSGRPRGGPSRRRRGGKGSG
ncbi:MAG: HIT domain-containing protein [Acidobacteriota bacterium]